MLRISLKIRHKLILSISLMVLVTFCSCAKLKNPNPTGQSSIDVEKCSVCHGSKDNPAPPNDTKNNTDTSLVTVGAHQAHLKPKIGRVVACEECHQVPTSVDDVGHMNPGPAEVIFNSFSKNEGSQPSWNHSAATCSSTYCHGASLPGGNKKNPLWTQVNGTQKACDSCHGNPPPSPHPNSAACSVCHPETVNGDGSIKSLEKHIDGKLQVLSGAGTCTACHGSPQNAAPPRDTHGNTDTHLITVGAHQAHQNPRIGKPVPCSECHHVPASTMEPGHVDESPAEIIWGSLAGSQNAKPEWNRTTARCSNTYCHGATLSGGYQTAPQWTKLDGSQVICTACHGYPPPLPHTTSLLCMLCHTETMAADGTILSPDKHMDGIVEVIPNNTSCNTCHGNAQNAAPPKDTRGETSTALLTVGAHQAHLNPVFSKPAACSECHVVPAGVNDPGHINAGPAEVIFGSLAITYNSKPVWDPAGSCSSTYCHGRTTGLGGKVTKVKWTQMDGTQRKCDSCHGYPPPEHHGGTPCSECHDLTMNPDGTIKAPELHINGVLESKCGTCH